MSDSGCVKVYVGRNRKGIWRATKDEQLAKQKFKADCFVAYLPNLIDNKLYMVQTYYGYKIDPVTGKKKSIFETEYAAYHTKVDAKHQSNMWRDADDIYRTNRERYTKALSSIGSRDYKRTQFAFNDKLDFETLIITVHLIDCKENAARIDIFGGKTNESHRLFRN